MVYTQCTDPRCPHSMLFVGIPPCTHNATTRVFGTPDLHPFSLSSTSDFSACGALGITSGHPRPERMHPNDRQCCCTFGPEPHQEMQSIWKFFRFRDLEWERKYQASNEKASRGADLAVIFVTGLVSTVITLYGCLIDQHPFIARWPFALASLLSLCLYCLLLFVRRAKRHTVVLVYSWMVIVLGLLIYGMYLTYPEYLEASLQRVQMSPESGKDPCQCDISGFRRELGMEMSKQLITLGLGITSVMINVVALGRYSIFTILFVVAANLVLVFLIVTFPHLGVGGALEMTLRVLLVCFLWPLVCCIAFTSAQRLRFAAESLHERTLQAAREADSILNHTLKNTMADAAGLIEVCLGRTGMPESVQTDLGLSLACLYRGMRACRYRQVYMSLVAGTYVAVPEEAQVREFLFDLVKGREGAIEIHCASNLIASVDPVMLSLILDNALSNATKYGHPTKGAIQITVVHHALTGLAFKITNIANPNDLPITEGFMLSRLNGTHPRSTNAMSDGIGLKHCHLAALASSTSIDLMQHGDKVTFEACVSNARPTSALLSDSDDLDGPATEDLSAFPSGLVTCCIDDSAISLRTLQYALESRASSQVHTYGHKGSADISLFMQQTLAEADIAILDKNLDFPGNHTSGLDLVEQLRSASFDGLLCIRSGNTSEKDTADYLAAGAHCTVGKEVPMSETIALIKAAYLVHVNSSVARARHAWHSGKVQASAQGATSSATKSSKKPKAPFAKPAALPEPAPIHEFTQEHLHGQVNLQILV